MTWPADRPLTCTVILRGENAPLMYKTPLQKMQYPHVFHSLNQFVVYTQGSHNYIGVTKLFLTLKFSPCGMLWPVEWFLGKTS